MSILKREKGKVFHKCRLPYCEVSILVFESLEKGYPETFYVILLFLKARGVGKYTCAATFHLLLMPYLLVVLPFGTVESVQMRKKSCDVIQLRHYSVLLHSSI
jgi:hypothetical protein